MCKNKNLMIIGVFFTFLLLQAQEIKRELLQAGDYYISFQDYQDDAQTDKPYKITTEFISPNTTSPIANITGVKKTSKHSGGNYRFWSDS